MLIGLISTVSLALELFPPGLTIALVQERFQYMCPPISPPSVHKLALIESDRHKINKLNEAVDIIHLAHVTCGY